MTSSIANCRHCGSTKPGFKHDDTQQGHGLCSTNYWIECPCGIRTIAFGDSYDGTMIECRLKALQIWNRVQEL